ncbi:hypothetical protein BDW72DRAFT_181337 [Aspergillus terricola var. indicus]
MYERSWNPSVSATSSGILPSSSRLGLRTAHPRNPGYICTRISPSSVNFRRNPLN